ncbi:MBL fold metallo-hydrolase [Defluviimonas sp. SAOS-178_SWC]|uniref:MBL fold metallo-hydrolase n=1 Tax=Defluviimonas sp. SAOS-178_SWC TaxID=3121287 RepID=UPI0032215FED
MPKQTSPTLRFLGAAGSGTGSRYLIEVGDRRILVDCGLFQGFKTLRDRNRKPFPVRPSTIDTVLLSHAHLDHSGYLPDSGHTHEEGARCARKHGHSKLKKLTPPNTRADAAAALEWLRVIPFRTPVDLGDGVRVEFIPAGHLPGAAQIRLSRHGTTVLFSGDLGRQNDALMQPPRPFSGADQRRLRMFGRDFPIRPEVIQLEAFSCHADADELMNWMRAPEHIETIRLDNPE